LSDTASPRRPAARRILASSLLALAAVTAGTMTASAATSTPRAAHVAQATGAARPATSIHLDAYQAVQNGPATHGSGGSRRAHRPLTPRQVARKMLSRFHWRRAQFGPLNKLWNVESHWNVHAANPFSGAYGIPQAMPGSKMASAGPSWRSNAATQIRWGMRYIRSVYGSPLRAWSHEISDGWY
jgi:hypothetical protein